MYQNVNSNNNSLSTQQQQQLLQGQQLQIQTTTSYGGMNAEEKSSYTNQSVIGGYIKGISSYIPSSIKSSIKKQISNSPILDGNDKDTLVGTFFDECEINFEKHKLLINCYNNGFQVWDLNHIEGVKEILSIRETGLIKFCKVLTNPLEKDPSTSNFYGKRPLLAVVSGEDNSKLSRNMVRIFSLQSNELVNMYKFRTPIYNVLSNRQLVLICLKERIVGFNPLTMDKEISLPCYPSANPMGVVALGSRWIAYIDYETSHGGMISSGRESMGDGSMMGGLKSQNQTFSDTAVDVATDLAKEVASKLYYFGDIGRKKVSSYLGGGSNGSNGSGSGVGNGSHVGSYEDNLSISPNSNSSALSSFVGGGSHQPEVAGVIVVYDFIKHKAIAVIKPHHSHPISYLTFDQSGTLLFSTTSEGTKVNVYRIIPFTNSLVISSPNTFTIASNNSSGSNNSGGAITTSSINSDSTFRQIYILKRGITNASVQGISVNETGKWVSLTTSRGTTHLFAINPLGGEVDIHTHITKSPSSKHTFNHHTDYYNSFSKNIIPNLLTLNAMDRIKLGNESQQEDTGKLISSSPLYHSISAGSSCFIESDQQNIEKLFVCSPTGQLILFEIRPQKPPLNSEMNENSLCLSIQPVGEWDVCRKTRHQEFRLPTTPFTDTLLHRAGIDHYNHMKQLDDEARWLYNVEIVTHSQDIKAVWGIPQFSFRSISSFDQSALNKPFFDIDYPDGEPIKLEKKKVIVSPRTGIESGEILIHNPDNNNNNNNNNRYHNHTNVMGGFTAINNDNEDDMEMILKINEAMETSINQIPKQFDDYNPLSNNNINMNNYSPQNFKNISNTNGLNIDQVNYQKSLADKSNMNNNNKLPDYSNLEDSVFMKPPTLNYHHSNGMKQQKNQNDLDNEFYPTYPNLNQPPIPTIPISNSTSTTNTTTTTTTTTNNNINKPDGNSTNPIPIPSKKLPPITKTQPNLSYSDYDDINATFSQATNTSGSSSSSSSSTSPKLPFSSPPKQPPSSKGKRNK